MTKPSEEAVMQCNASARLTGKVGRAPRREARGRATGQERLEYEVVAPAKEDSGVGEGDRRRRRAGAPGGGGDGGHPSHQRARGGRHGHGHDASGRWRCEIARDCRAMGLGFRENVHSLGLG